MELKNLFQNDDRAVSPVIGVILMVAITVILAAVIGTFVLGLGDDIDSEVTAGVTIDGNDASTERTVSWTSQGTADEIIIRNSAGDTASDVDDADAVISGIGGSVTIDNADNFSVVAVSDDGRETVIRTFTVS